MSGDIFHPLQEALEGLDVSRWNPLLCYLCNEKYDEPCILGCYHTFCSRCLCGRATDGKMTCPLCGSITVLKDNDQLPQTDRLMKFLVTSSCEEREQCANCDMVADLMYFCNTCKQPLCDKCREETHSAKMFSRHDIVTLSKRTKEIHRQCPLHFEPYILFSTEKKTMLCINCFRDMKIESRSYCVDMETAYNQGCKKLDNSMQAIKELQNSVRDSILLLRALLEEIRQNSDVEKTAILELYDKMQQETMQKKDSLLEAVDRQYQEKESLFKEELSSLSTLHPTLHAHLVTCAAFSSSANKFEFLDLAYILMERLKSIITRQHPLHPSQGSQICTDFRAQFASCLEPLLFPHRNTSSLGSQAVAPLSLTSVSSTGPRYEVSNVSAMVSTVRTSNSGRRYSKIKVTEGKSAFTEHCKEFDSSHKDLTILVDRLKNQLQELQRDLTLRRCLTRSTTVEDLQSRVDKVEEQLMNHKARVEQKQPVLEKHWEEALQRIAGEQDIYQAQLQDVMRIQQETSHLRTMLNQLSRFVTSITAVSERLAPKLASSTKECDHENQIAALFEQISTMQHDSQHRVDAIRTAEVERETLSAANRTNPLDEELIKTKGMLKAPSARQNVSRRDSTKHESREIKVDSKETTKSLDSKQTSTTAGKDVTKSEQDATDKENKVAVSQKNMTSSTENEGKLSDSVGASVNKNTDNTTKTSDSQSQIVENDLSNTKNGDNIDKVLPFSDKKLGQNTENAVQHLVKQENENSSTFDTANTVKSQMPPSESKKSEANTSNQMSSEEKISDTAQGKCIRGDDTGSLHKQTDSCSCKPETPLVENRKETQSIDQAVENLSKEEKEKLKSLNTEGEEDAEMTGGESLKSRIERLRDFVGGKSSESKAEDEVTDTATSKQRRSRSSRDIRRERGRDSKKSSDSQNND